MMSNHIFYCLLHPKIPRNSLPEMWPYIWPQKYSHYLSSTVLGSWWKCGHDSYPPWLAACKRRQIAAERKQILESNEGRELLSAVHVSEMGLRRQEGNREAGVWAWPEGCSCWTTAPALLSSHFVPTLCQGALTLGTNWPWLTNTMNLFRYLLITFVDKETEAQRR